MNYIAGSDRGEALLLPEVLDDYIAPENPVRFIDAFVAQLDLSKAGFTNAQLKERKKELESLAQDLGKSGGTQVSLTDPDSRAMSMGRGSTIGYNVQAAVDAKHSLIVDTQVTNTTSDLGALGIMAIKTQKALEAKNLSVVADKGYYNGKEVLVCDTIGVTAYVAKPLTSANTARGLYGKESFTYDAKKDALRVKAKPEMVGDSQETLEYTFDPVTDNTAQVNIRWEKVRVPFTVSIKDVNALAFEKARAAVAAAKPDDFQTPLQAARFAIQNKNADEGMKWLEQSIKAKPTFGNLSAKANLLWANGRKEEALAVAGQAIERGKADKVDTAGFEKRVADMKAGKL